ncbi:MAG: ABC-2 transporter permease [Oscillospiraceae bacterium]|nr:ABC-2 transporter permease [Oscillospiraceae bacterium]
MKALLRLNYYMIGGYKIVLAVAAILFFVLLLPLSRRWDVSFSVILSLNFGAAIGFTPIGIEKAESVCRWRSYAKTLPYTREQLVDAKYLFSLLSAAAAALLGAVMLPLLMLRNPEAVSALTYAPSAAELSFMNAALAAAIVLYAAAIHYPSYFRRTGGIVLFAVGFSAFIFAFAIFFAKYMMALDRCKWAPLTSSMHLVPYLLLAGSAVCCLLSWLYTRKTYCRRKRRRAA